MKALELLDELQRRGLDWRVTAIEVDGVKIDLIPCNPAMAKPAEEEQPDVRTQDDIAREERELLDILYGAARGYIPSAGDG